MSETTFYDHFHQDKPTGLGAWVASRFSQRILTFAGMKAGDKVLEIGPGRGVFADLCFEHSIDYSAIEPNPHLAQSLESRGATVVRAIVPPLPELEEKFDYVVMINVLEHMSGVKEALAVAEQVRRCLAPKGQFVVCSPDYLNLRWQFFNCDFSHGYVTTQRRLAQLLISAGYGGSRSCYLAGPVSGFVGILLSGLAAWLPFGALHAWFPTSRLCLKLYKIQLTFSRKVLIVGENPG
jgi:SAM-dependent methyltransferase